MSKNRLLLCLATILLFIQTNGTVGSAVDPGMTLYLPAVAFPSLRATFSRQHLLALRNGTLDPDLVLDRLTFDALRKAGINLSAQTHIVEPAGLQKTLWDNVNLYTLLAFDALKPRYRLLYVDEQLPLDGDLSGYPFAFMSDHPNYDPQKLTRVLLSGTTAFTRTTADSLDAHGLDWAAEAIRPYTRRADFFHTSNEVSFDPDCRLSGKGILRDALDFCAKDSYFNLLTDLGLDIVELSGNHNNDYGYADYLRTLKLYRDHGIQTIGGGEDMDAARKPLVLNHHGNRIVLLSCNQAGPDKALVAANRPGAAFCDPSWLKATLPQLKQQADVVIVTVQYTEYDSFSPTDQQRADFHQLADLGADVVIGTQAHHPQIMEFYRATPNREAFIHYGTGNLYFDELYYDSMFFMDDLFIYEGRLVTVHLFTGIIDDYARPRPMTPAERNALLQPVFARGFNVTP